MMATFDQISIGEIFFEGETGEYYIKKDEVSSAVYDISEDAEAEGFDGKPIICIFPEEHQVEDI